MVYLSLEGDFWSLSGIGPIPNSGVPISVGRHHNGSHDGGDVEGGPLRHEGIEKHLLAHALVASLLHFVLHRDASWVMHWVGLVTIVVGLNQKPSGISELVGCVNRVSIPFNHRPFVGSHARHDEVNGTSNSFSFQSFYCRGIIGFFSQNLP